MAGGFNNKGPGGDELTAAEELWVQTGNAGVLLLEEQGSAPSATSGVGKVYVKSSDGLLYFKDDAGVEYLLSGGAGGFTLLPATGSVNSVNATFTFTEKPDYIVSDGVWYRENKGWTWSVLTATMTIPPNDDIYGFT